MTLAPLLKFFQHLQRYDSNYSVGNVQTLHKIRSKMEIPTDDDDVDGVDEQHVVETHLENLWKQKSA